MNGAAISTKQSTTNGVAETEVAKARFLLDERTFRAEYEASFEASTGRCIPDFKDANITDEADDDSFDTLMTGIDFNIAILPAIICRIVGDELWVVNENSALRQGLIFRATLVNPNQQA